MKLLLCVFTKTGSLHKNFYSFMIAATNYKITWFLWSTSQRNFRIFFFLFLFLEGEEEINHFDALNASAKFWSSFKFFLEKDVSKELCLQIKKPIIYGKEDLLLSDLLEDIKHFCKKNGTEESIITIVRTLRRKIIDTFPGEISFYPNGKYLIVHSNDVNPCHQLVSPASERQRFKGYLH